MKILYIHQYFRTPDVPGGTRSYWNCRKLIQEGHEVTVIGTDKDIDSSSVRFQRDGIDIIYLKVAYKNTMGVLRRIWAFLSFMFLSTRVAFGVKKVDLVIATSTPLTVGFPALLLKKFKGIPYVFEVRDLWPEAPIQMGAIKNGLLIRFLRWFEKVIYRNASHVIALSPGMKDGVLETGIPEEKVSMVPNMAKMDEFWSRPPNKTLVAELGLKEDTFKCMYFGTLGPANAIDYILDTAILLKDREDIEFFFAGAGAMSELVEKTIEKEQLKNVKYLGLFNMEQLSEVVNLGDVSIVTFTNIPILATNSPNKLFDSLSAGKPIIVNSPGWTKTMVEDNECGVFVDPTSPKDFVDKILFLKDSPELRAKMAKNSRRLAETKYDKSILTQEFVDAVHKVEISKK